MHTANLDFDYVMSNRCSLIPASNTHADFEVKLMNYLHAIFLCRISFICNFNLSVLLYAIAITV